MHTSSSTRRAAALTMAALLLAGCRIDVAEEAAPEGYHRMGDGTLMADVVMETEYRAASNDDGFSLPTHTRPDGTVILGSAPDHANGDHGGHDHAVADPADFPQGVVPVRLVIPRLDLDAPIVPTTMTSGAVQGPPVAGDVAWLEQTRRPGEIGPAVLGGVDDLQGTPGAYRALRDLAPGDEFVIVSDEGELLHFRVEDTWSAPVADRSRIFAAGGARPEVRLVDWAIDGEESDHVVSAFVVSSTD